ncbi:hypothetical protein PAXRUDRAFT_18558 [Paxillus rubicundulus Ve08.2h10]|uniref:Uncharacterized protein n=1 Tax=Paxillus rubicundulus Ve08.2h10 TaxID=930991 RepID=A0A0D0DEK0_9AGAM|nr:hypothetical protein PAXRUDRAFT_18558 [Paxillus rubicundulus Ve08.2h10]
MDDTMMEFDYRVYSDNNKDDAGLAQGNMGMEVDEAYTIYKDKVVTLDLKNDHLHIKLNHEHHCNKQAFAHEEWTSEQANAAILHQYQMEKLETNIHLQDAEARTYE